MRYELRLTAYDMLDQVHVTLTTYMTGDDEGDVSKPVLHWTRTAPGTGQCNPVLWTRDTLVEALEIL